MRERAVKPADLGITRLLWSFSILSLLLLVALAVAPLRSYFTEWRATQRRYNALAAERGLPNLDVGVKQIWKPDLGVVDRCGSCHVGAAGGAPIDSEPVFAAHPRIPHDPRAIGCTVCHAGQGRATTKEAAHGRVPHWDEPLLERRHVEAGCGTCHSHIPVPPARLAASGQAIVAEAGCLRCHGVDGAGGGDGPDLSFAGLAGFSAGWHDAHREHAAAAEGGPWAGFAPLADEEVVAVDQYLRTLAGAPRLVAGKALAYRLGCRGCHRIAGVGGDDGPDLSDVGRKNAGDLDFSTVNGPHTLATWLGEHLLAPGRVVPGSQMPVLGVSEDEAGLVVTYLLSLRARPLSLSQAPRDRVRGARLGERDFATDGESLFGVFCVACHGPAGVGRRYQAIDVTFPAVGNADFLALAGDPFLARTLTEGRPGRRMPAWGVKDGGLRPEEIRALVAYLRSLEPPGPSLEEVLAAPLDVEAGRATFAGACAPCHGAAGEGSAIGPPLAAGDNPATKEDSRVYGTLTVGVAGTAMGAFRRLDAPALRGVIAAVRSLPAAGVRTGWAPQPGTAANGQVLYAERCAKCHGARAEGGTGPALANPAFLATASDGYLAATIVRGRSGTQMPPLGVEAKEQRALVASEVADIVAFLRSLAPPGAR